MGTGDIKLVLNFPIFINKLFFCAFALKPFLLQKHLRSSLLFMEYIYVKYLAHGHA